MDSKPLKKSPPPSILVVACGHNCVSIRLQHRRFFQLLVKASVSIHTVNISSIDTYCIQTKTPTKSAAKLSHYNHHQPSSNNHHFIYYYQRHSTKETIHIYTD